MSTDKKQLSLASRARAVILNPVEYAGPQAPQYPLTYMQLLHTGEFYLWHAVGDMRVRLEQLSSDSVAPVSDQLALAMRRAMDKPSARSFRRLEAMLTAEANDPDVQILLATLCAGIAEVMPFHRAVLGCAIASAQIAAAALDAAALQMRQGGDPAKAILLLRGALLWSADAQSDASDVAYVPGPIYTRVAAYDQRAQDWLRILQPIADAEEMLRIEDDIVRGGAGMQADSAEPTEPSEDLAAILAPPKKREPKAAGLTLVVFPAVTHLPKPSAHQIDKADSPRALVEPWSLKPMPLVPAPDPAAFAAGLDAEFPWAREVTAIYAAALVGVPYAWLPPKLLVGGAGGGKTAYARAVLRRLGLDVTVYGAAGQMDGSAFAGTSRMWGTWRPSTVAQAILRAKFASVGIVIDEVEKAGTSRRWGRLDETILPFLERSTARVIHDPAIEGPVDTSATTYILTANDLAGVSGPLRDRVQCIEWPMPRAQDLSLVANAILGEIRAERGLDEVWCPAFDAEELAMMPWRGGSLRPLRRQVEALLAGREAYARSRSH